MAWKYEPTEEETKAAEFLKEKGWYVTEPSCPLCNGWGYEINYSVVPAVDYGMKPCSNGCTASLWHF